MIETGLARYDAMCTAIAACHNIDEVKDFRDKARALEVYAAQAKNVEAERKAAEVRIRAERRSGELLREMKELGTRDSGMGGDRKSQSSVPTVKLSDLGISKTQSSQWQALADIPEEDFEEELTRSIRPTTEGILNSRGDTEQRKISSESVRVWGIFKDFERYGLIDIPLTDLVSDMTEPMIEDMVRLTPRITTWIKESSLHA